MAPRRRRAPEPVADPVARQPVGASLAREQVLAVVRDALVTVLEVEPAFVQPISTLAELRADSLALVETAEIVEHRLAAGGAVPVHIRDDDLARMETVGQLVDYLAARV